MAHSREQVCESTSRKLLAGSGEVARSKALVGLDGFVDEIIAVVDKRYADGRFDPIRTIASFGDKIRAAAGESSNYELVVKQAKLGGNGPIMANALASLGLGVTYIGNLGYPDLHPVFHDFAKIADVITIAPPGHTDALEFDDGKIMLGKQETLHEVNWENLQSRVGRDRLDDLVGSSRLIGMVNWTMLPGMSRIWHRLLDEVLPHIKGRPTVFADLADPEKRTPEDIRAALGLLTQFQQYVDVILGLNLKEAMQVAAVLNLPSRSDPEATIDEEAAAIRERPGDRMRGDPPEAGGGGGNGERGGALPGAVRQATRHQHGGGRSFQRGLLRGADAGAGPGGEPMRRRRHERVLRPIGREPLAG